ncbi:MAG: RluA family pseudouridine synthase [Bdellovibrio sp.]|nr:RluA family pseudouridine synthase [Bdellovibrio sp.]
MQDFKKIPKKYQPKGYEILYEDLDLFVGNKSAGFLTVAALWNDKDTIHSALNDFVRKGNARSRKEVYVVHRLDQYTSGVLIFAKSENVQYYLKENWKSTVKHYYAIVHGKLAKKNGTITSYLEEDEDYKVHSNQAGAGKLAETEYQVLKETQHFSLIKINLLTGRKNQIRVHMADLGHPVVGDPKYGTKDMKKHHQLALHASTIEFTHPHSKKRIKFTAAPPKFFVSLVDYEYAEPEDQEETE